MNPRKFAAKLKRYGERPPVPAAEPAAVEKPAEPAAPSEIAEAKAESEKPVTATLDAAPQDAPAAAAAPSEKAGAAAASPAKGSRLVEGVRGKPALAKQAVAGWVAAALRAVRPSAAPVAATAALLLSVGIGYGIGTAGRPTDGGEALSARWLEATADMRAIHAEVTRLSTELKAVKGTVEAIKGERDKSRAEITARHTQLAQDTSARLTRLSEQLDRIEKTQRDPSRFTAVTERLDRLEKSLPSAPASAPTPPPKPVAANAAPPDVTQTASIPEPKPVPTDPRKVQVEGYFVRDVDEGFALIETKAGRYVDVAVGYTVPGVGRVEAIERRGRQWVVVTPKGFIGER